MIRTIHLASCSVESMASSRKCCSIIREHVDVWIGKKLSRRAVRFWFERVVQFSPHPLHFSIVGLSQASLARSREALASDKKLAFHRTTCVARAATRGEPVVETHGPADVGPRSCFPVSQKTHPIEYLPMSPRKHLTRGSPHRARTSASLLVFLLVFLVLVPLASTSQGEDRLTAAVIPPVVPAGVGGIAITVVGTNFHPGDGDDAFAIVCVFAGVGGPNAIVPARIVSGGGASCDVPHNPSPSGFVSVGLSGNGGVDARFFRGEAGGQVLAFAAPGVLRSTVGPRTSARGDALHFQGTDMAPPDTGGHAVVGASYPCGWQTADGDFGESPGAFVSTAVRVCETSPFIAGAGETYPTRIVATLDVQHKRSGVRGAQQTLEFAKNETDEARDATTGAVALAVVLAEPPVVTGVVPTTVAAEGGANLEISTSGTLGTDATRDGAWARVGTLRVAVDRGSNPDGSVRTTLWRCVTPARRPTPVEHQGTALSAHQYPSISIVASPFGAERVAVAATRVRFVSALRVASQSVPAFAFSSKQINPSAQLFPASSIAVAGHHATSILDALGVGSMEFSTESTTAFAFGVAANSAPSPALSSAAPAILSAYPSAGPSGGGGVVWVTGRSLSSAGCDFGFGFGEEAVCADTASVVVSSALVACEAPALSSARATSTMRVRISGASGAANYQYLPDVSPGYDDTVGGDSSVLAAPTNGPSRGGTTVSLSRPAKRKSFGSFGFDGLSSVVNAGGCRFGSVAVAARDVGDVSDDGVTQGIVSCVAPAGKPGRVTVAVVDSAPGAACTSGGYLVAETQWRRNRMDETDA